jgi:PhnB protein
MSKQFKPAGYNSVSPYFVVTGAKKMIDLLAQLFGARLMRHFERPDGAIMHAEIQIDDSIIMLGESSEQFQPTTFVMHVYVPDVDEVFEKALSLGCVSVEQPNEREGDPNRRGTFKDFAGNFWSVGTQL